MVTMGYTATSSDDNCDNYRDGSYSDDMVGWPKSCNWSSMAENGMSVDVKGCGRRP
jgi:hypothetical protein